MLSGGGVILPRATLASLFLLTALKFSKTCNPPIEWAEKGENDAGRVPLNVTTENFPLNKVAKRMSQVADELEHGTGAVMIANM